MSISDVARLDPAFQLVPWVILFPTFGLLVNLLFGKWMSQLAIGLVASLAVVGSFAVTILLAIVLAANPQAVSIHLFEWISVGNLNVGWNFRVDTLSIVMMLVVTGVGALIHIFAAGYMQKDVLHQGDPKRYGRFFVFFNLFILAMMVLVTADNYLMLFVGWEGVGLCSYLLIGFWYEKGQGGLGNARAGKKAFVVNRVGDFGLLIALFLIFWQFGSLDFDLVFSQVPQAAATAPAILLAITLFMFLGVTGKSAQLPLHVWLPDAMAGPTPVSALIHAATMVTAGVYLITRSSALFLAVPLAQTIVIWVGAITALFAATIAVGQNDIKRVLAYSTISQLGFMIAAVGMGAFVAGMFHLVTHAFFKALLFLAAGSVILGMEAGAEKQHHSENHDSSGFDPQDMRHMGGLYRRMPVTFWVYLFGGLALAGIVPLAGFFSKDEILAAANLTSPILYMVLLVAAFLTAFYIGRQILLVFFGEPRSKEASLSTENPPIITAPLIILAGLSLVGGAINFPGIYTLEHWLDYTLVENMVVKFNLPVAVISSVIAVAGLYVSWYVYKKKFQQAAPGSEPGMEGFGRLVNGMLAGWWVDDLYRTLLVRPFKRFSRLLAQTVDVVVIDGIVNGSAQLVRNFARQIGKVENGYVRSYVLSILIGLAFIMVFLLIRNFLV